VDVTGLFIPTAWCHLTTEWFSKGAGNSFLGGFAAGLLLAKNDIYEGKYFVRVLLPCI
jgi:hypothetical protein